MADFVITVGMDLRHGVNLDDIQSESPYSAPDDITLNEGGDAVTVNLRSILDGITGFSLTGWGDLNPTPTAVAIEIQKLESGSWVALTNVAFNDVVLNDFVLTETNKLTNGTFTIALNSGTIAANVDDVLRLECTITYPDS